jgi:diguanylate cyclase (GGDEF)-like protein
MFSRTEGLSEMKSAKIMIVDDEDINIAVVQTFLEDEGYTDFITIDDSSQAVATLIEERPDLLLLDLIMPQVSGFEILAEVRSLQKFAHLPVIILTAATDSANKIKALELGATDFLAKPLDESELVLRVRNTLGAKAYQDQLAFYDPLTKLPNRQLFMEEFSRSIDSAIRYDESLCLLSIEVDDSSSLKDQIGIASRDLVLQQIADRIETTIRKSDLTGITEESGHHEEKTYHFDSHVFMVLLSRVKTTEAVGFIASRILEEIKAPISIYESELQLTASIGVVSCPGDGKDLSELLLLASSAKDFAKKSGGDRFQFSSRTISSMYEKRLETETKLRHAIDNNELVLYYQPKVDLTSGGIVGAEALVRWQSAGKLVPPGDFIPLAEETGLIIPIGLWCLEEGCRQLSQWRKEGFNSLSLSVNLSAKQMADQSFFLKVQEIVERFDIPPGQMVLELTESLLIEDIEAKIELLHRLKAIGFKISIDDFGTGYSSLSYLRRLPIDELKIDRSFVMEISSHSQSRAIISTIVYLAESLNMITVAEGIEEQEELDFIKNLHCNQYQGFIFSRPVPADQFNILLQE